jgi:hypothetical protein
MYGVISLWEEQPSLETLPKSGMTVNGKLYPLPALAPPTAETESLLWPTPTTQESEHPKAELTVTGRRKAKNGNTHSLNLADSKSLADTHSKQLGQYGSQVNVGLVSRIGEITQEDKKQMTNGGKLNPMWVEWLMGFPAGWTDLEA